jgi:hypothetical protein
VAATPPPWWTRRLTGIPILISEFLFAFNLYMTWKYRHENVDESGLNAPLIAPTAEEVRA